MAQPLEAEDDAGQGQTYAHHQRGLLAERTSKGLIQLLFSGIEGEGRAAP